MAAVSTTEKGALSEPPLSGIHASDIFIYAAAIASVVFLANLLVFYHNDLPESRH
jgi:hypothetical protein